MSDSYSACKVGLKIRKYIMSIGFQFQRKERTHFSFLQVLFPTGTCHSGWHKEFPTNVNTIFQHLLNCQSSHYYYHNTVASF